MKDTDSFAFLGSLDATALKALLDRSISIVAGACVDNESSGSITLKLSFKQVGTSQVNVGHTLTTEKPAMRGSDTTKRNGSTVFNVHREGVTLGTIDQMDMLNEPKERDIPSEVNSLSNTTS